MRRLDSSAGKANRLRRMDTSQSARSRKSNTGIARSVRNQTSMASLFDEEEEEVKVVRPFDTVFGEKINDYIQQSTGGSTIGLTFSQFKEIKWPNVFPHLICDLLETIAGFSME